MLLAYHPFGINTITFLSLQTKRFYALSGFAMSTPTNQSAGKLKEESLHVLLGFLSAADRQDKRDWSHRPPFVFASRCLAEHLEDRGRIGYGIYVKNYYICYMKTLTVNVPDNLEMDNRYLAMLVSTRLYEQGKLSIGQAAEVAGLSKRTFAELLGSYNVSIFNFPASDLSRDVANA